MVVKVTNASRSLVLIRTRSGPTIYLGGGEQTEELPEHEIIGNPRVEPLRERGVITVQTVELKPKGRGGSTAAKAAAKSGEAAANEGKVQ